jgi:hypothetical protein
MHELILLQNMEPVFRLLVETEPRIEAFRAAVRLVHLELDELRAPAGETAGGTAQQVKADVAAARLRQHEEIDHIEPRRPAPGGEGHEPEAGADQPAALIGHHDVDEAGGRAQPFAREGGHEVGADVLGKAPHHARHRLRLAGTHRPHVETHAERPFSSCSRLRPRLSEG